MIKLNYRINDKQFLLDIEKLKPALHEAMMKGLQEGADDLRDYIKYELLSGQLVKLHTKQLRNSLWVKRSSKGTLTIFFRDTHHRASGESDGEEKTNEELADILEKGRIGKWWQPRRRRWHKGIKPHLFMERGLAAKAKRIVSLAEFQINAELRRQRRG